MHKNPHHGIESRFTGTRLGVGGVKRSCKPAWPCVPPASTSTKIGWFGVRFSDNLEPFSSSPSAASSEPRSESECDEEVEDEDEDAPSSAISRRVAARACCLARRRRRSRCMSAALKRIMRAPERTPASAIAERTIHEIGAKSAVGVRNDKDWTLADSLSGIRQRARAKNSASAETHTMNRLKSPLRG